MYFLFAEWLCEPHLFFPASLSSQPYSVYFILILTPAERISEFCLGSSLELLFRVAEDWLPWSLLGAVAYKVDFIVSALWYKHRANICILC